MQLPRIKMTNKIIVVCFVKVCAFLFIRMLNVVAIIFNDQKLYRFKKITSIYKLNKSYTYITFLRITPEIFPILIG